MPACLDLTGRCAIVSAAGRGLGAAAALTLTEAGAGVAIVKELGPSGIRVNAICPGWIEGERMEMLAQRRAAETGITPEAMMQAILATSSLGLAMRPADIGAMILFLASYAGDCIFGQTVVVDADSL